MCEKTDSQPVGREVSTDQRIPLNTKRASNTQVNTDLEHYSDDTWSVYALRLPNIPCPSSHLCFIDEMCGWYGHSVAYIFCLANANHPTVFSANEKCRNHKTSKEVCMSLCMRRNHWEWTFKCLSGKCGNGYWVSWLQRVFWNPAKHWKHWQNESKAECGGQPPAPLKDQHDKSVINKSENSTKTHSEYVFPKYIII